MNATTLRIHTTCNAVMEWTQDDSNERKQAFGVYGLAGTGKSTLHMSTTIVRSSHRCFTRRPYHSLQQIRPSSRQFLLQPLAKGCLWLARLVPYGSKITSRSDSKIFEFRMPAPAYRCSHPFDANSWVCSIAFSPIENRLGV